MPVFFYIDPKFDDNLENLQTPFIQLTYKFYKSINNDQVNEQVEEFKENYAQEQYEKSLQVPVGVTAEFTE